jgi:hypothetical protein
MPLVLPVDVALSFIGGGNRNIRRKNTDLPQFIDKQLQQDYVPSSATHLFHT